MKTTRRIISYTALIILLFLASCGKDFLDRKPLGRYTTESYPSGGLNQYVFGMYSDLRGFNVHVWPYIGVFCITSDDSDKGSTSTDGPEQIQFDHFTILADNVLLKGMYTDNYAAINKCNIVLQQAEKMKTTLKPEDYNTATAEAKFVRGYLYFNMVRVFGRIPKVDSVITDQANFNIPQSSKEEIYSFIESDLNFAAANLPLRWDSKFIGRPTSGSAKGILAKVYLYEQNYEACRTMCHDIINSGVYDLKTPYNVIFTEAGENSSESIFEIQAVYNFTYQYGCDYADVQGVRGSGDWNLGWGFNVPSAKLIAAYEASDPRKDATVLSRGVTLPTGETPPATLPNKTYNKKVYTSLTIRKELAGLPDVLYGKWTNIRILRYADVVLMAAEAANELKDTTEAVEKLEWVRARARAGNNTILPKVTGLDQAGFRAAIQHERRIELAMEHERFFDLIRWNLAVTYLGIKGFKANRNELMPIPQSEIDKSNGVLTQNPGY